MTETQNGGAELTDVFSSITALQISKIPASPAHGIGGKDREMPGE